ncbi:MAG: RsmD family RNA methyltransferase [Clostridia bacterium]|nr:RsmD family RNA methyltransferase [Clostridia bacterium]
MRIIAGEFRSRTLLAPKGMDTRPTLDRTRESLFNIISAECPEARVLDLYAGSGALALEALSRGAASAVFCDKSREAARVISANITSLKVEDRARLMAMSDQQAVRTLQQEGTQFDWYSWIRPIAWILYPLAKCWMKRNCCWMML